MKMHGLAIVVFSLAAAAHGCAAQEVKVSEQPTPAASSPAPPTSPGGALLQPPPSPGECEATFHLCARYVKESQLVDFPQASEHWVSIQLTEDGRQSLEEFTKAWMKRSVCITLGSERVIATPVQAVIPSGRLMASKPSAQAAQALVDKLRVAPEGPCGS